MEKKEFSKQCIGSTTEELIEEQNEQKAQKQLHVDSAIFDEEFKDEEAELQAKDAIEEMKEADAEAQWQAELAKDNPVSSDVLNKHVVK